MKVFDSLSLLILLVIFGGAAAFVWVAGIRLPDTTDVLSSRFGLARFLSRVLRRELWPAPDLYRDH